MALPSDALFADQRGERYTAADIAAAGGGSGGADAVPVYAGKSGTSSRSQGVLDASPLALEGVVTYVPQDFKAGDVIAKLALFVASPGDGAAVADAGIYVSLANGRPGARAAHTGNMPVTSQPASHTVSYTVPTTGRYWLAAVTSGSATTPATLQTVTPGLPLANASADPLTMLNGAGDANIYAEVGNSLPATAAVAPIATTGGAFAVAFSFA